MMSKRRQERPDTVFWVDAHGTQHSVRLHCSFLHNLIILHHLPTHLCCGYMLARGTGTARFSKMLADGKGNALAIQLQLVHVDNTV